jgi:hypothetical protein
MPARRQSEPLPERSRRKPATTPEGRENQLISLAHDLVERRIREGTASAQETVHFLKLGSSRERLEQQRLAHENQLTQVKIETMESQARIEELYTEAITAMRAYSGSAPTESELDYED